MKNKKNGFSLMELLLVMAIIAVILTIGFSISKQGIERAYNKYFYTGYVGIYEALANATMQDISINAGDFIDKVADILNANVTGGTTITAPNGVIYEFESPVNAIVNNNANESIDYIKIKMTIPNVKKSNSLNSTFLIFSPNFRGGMLIPLSPNAQNPNAINLQTRVDLLPFYINTGIEGKVFVSNNGNGIINKEREILSYLNTHCKRYGTTKFGNNLIINCNGISDTNSENVGFIQIADPTRAF